MGDSTAWRDTVYRNAYDRELRGLERRRAAEADLKIDDVKGVLKHLYHLEGADWVGRGELQDLDLAATIAAYEHFIAAWPVAALP